DHEHLAVRHKRPRVELAMFHHSSCSGPRPLRHAVWRHPENEPYHEKASQHAPCPRDRRLLLLCHWVHPVFKTHIKRTADRARLLEPRGGHPARPISRFSGVCGWIELAVTLNLWTRSRLRTGPARSRAGPARVDSTTSLCTQNIRQHAPMSKRPPPSILDLG